MPILIANVTSPKIGQDVRISMNVGDFDLKKMCPDDRFRDLMMAQLSEESFRRLPGRLRAMKGTTEEELQATNVGEEVSSLPTPVREFLCFIHMLYGIGGYCRANDAIMRFENHDRTKMKVVTAENLKELVEQAKGLDQGNDLWLVVEGKIWSILY